MTVFAVRDKAWTGRGIFALFSTVDRALEFLDRSTGIVKLCGEVTELSIVLGYGEGLPDTIFAAFTYDDLYDSHIFDGLYADRLVAWDVAGPKGQVFTFVIDSPDNNKAG
jgi:hypothetical protein